MSEYVIRGLPDQTEYEAAVAVCRSRVLMAITRLEEETGWEDLDLRLAPESILSNQHAEQDLIGKFSSSDDPTLDQRARQYEAVTPLYQIDHLIVPREVRAEIDLAIHSIRVEATVYDTWGLRKIEPFPRSALNFHGAPGTGKTLAAHAVASALGKRILVASYAQIESKFHGDGPKNVEALFFAAQRDEAVLFIDEADSLLSRRLTNVTQGSEQAINSMRSQLLICLEKFKGTVIFATNLVENYDQAFETRVRHVEFPMPNTEAREAIWRNHLPPELPLADDVHVHDLARAEEVFCGRDIKNAVVKAATQSAIDGKILVGRAELQHAIMSIVQARAALRGRNVTPISNEDPDLQERILESLSAQVV